MAFSSPRHCTSGRAWCTHITEEGSCPGATLVTLGTTKDFQFCFSRKGYTIWMGLRNLMLHSMIEDITSSAGIHIQTRSICEESLHENSLWKNLLMESLVWGSEVSIIREVEPLLIVQAGTIPCRKSCRHSTNSPRTVIIWSNSWFGFGAQKPVWNCTVSEFPIGLKCCF